MAKVFVHEVIFHLLTNFAVDDVVEYNLTANVEVTPVAKDEPKAKVAKVFENDDEVFFLEALEEGDLIYFDYANPHSGSIGRVGYVTDVDGDTVLLYDLTATGSNKIRRFSHEYIENPRQLS